MKIIYFTILLIVLSNKLTAQNNYIIAGQIENISFYHDIIPDEQISANVTFGEGETNHYYLDLNNDNIDDFDFTVTNNGGLGGWTRGVTIKPLNQNSVSFSHYHITPGELPCSDTLYIGVAKKYYFGDTIFFDSSFMESTLALNKNSWLTSCHDYDFSVWPYSENLFIGLSIENSGTYSFGWVNVHSASYNTITIDSYYYDENAVLTIEESNKSVFNIYPNPTTNYFNIECTSNAEITEFDFFDINGLKHNLEYSIVGNKVSLHTGNLNKGVYFLKLHTLDNLYVYKVLKE